MPGHIDMHAHYYGGGLVDFLTARAERPCLRPADSGGREMLAMNGAFPFLPAHWDHQVGLAQMDTAGIDRRMLTFPGALCLDVLPAEEAAPVIRDFNDHLADLGRDTGGRIVGLAGLPLEDMGAAAGEMRRVRRDLGLPGAILPADYFNTVAEARLLTPVFEAANESGALLMVHPGPRVGVPPAPPAAEFAQYRTSAVALQSQLAQVTLTLILSDLLDAFPRIRWQVVNLGGTLPFIFERMEAIARHRSPDAPFPTERMRRIWYDCASLGPRALEAGVALYGADRIMLGTDWPIFREAPGDTALDPARIDDDARALVSHGTAAALLEALAADVKG
jgi:aminocarboxymuconate-semialdehyde decarboxylase